MGSIKKYTSVLVLSIRTANRFKKVRFLCRVKRTSRGNHYGFIGTSEAREGKDKA